MKLLNSKWDDSQMLLVSEINSRIDLLSSFPDCLKRVFGFEMRILEQYKALAIDMYVLRRKARGAALVALDSDGDPELWHKAEQVTWQADQKMQSFLRHKLYSDILSHHFFYWGTPQNHLMITGLVFSLSRGFLESTSWVEPEYIELFKLLMLLMSTLLMLGKEAFKKKDTFRTDFNSLCGELILSEELRCMALEAGIELGAGKRLLDTESLISQLMYVRNNEKALKDINCLNTPRELNCAISLNILTDPVYADPSPERFELQEIIPWLAVKTVHPITNQPLYLDDLKRDFDLKRLADAYVDEKLSLHRHEVSKKSLVHLSKFSCTASASSDDASGQLIPRNGPGLNDL